jgi:dipeptidyl aminopeptidase/acylaminoacyl peptidase
MNLLGRGPLFGLAVLASLTAAAHAAPPPLEAYGRLPHVEQVSLSPNGDKFAMIELTENSRRVLIAPVDGGSPMTFDFPLKDKIRRVDWAGDEHVVVTASATLHDGAVFTVDALEIPEVVVFPLNNKPSFVVFKSQPHVLPMVADEFGYAQIGGRWFGYFGAVSANMGRGLYKVDLDTGQADPVRVSNGPVQSLAVGPDGSILARTFYFAKTGAWQINSGRSDNVILSGHSLTGNPTINGLGRSSDTLLVYNPDPTVEALQVVPLAGGPTAPAGSDAAGLLFDRASQLWIGKVIQGDVPKTVLFSEQAQAKLDSALKAFSKYNVSLVSYDAKFDHLIVFTDGGDDSGTYWLVDGVKHSAESIGQAYPEVKEADVGPFRIFDWKAQDGLEEHGVLTLPPGRPAHGLPVVVLPHGGPQQRDYLGFDWWAEAFASRGYAVFQPNFRGSEGYGRAFVHAGHGQWGRKMQTDISDGLAALVAQGIVDAKRACIVGASYGGYAALAGVTVQNGLYRCAVADAGVSDLQRMLKYEDARGGYRGPTTSLRYWRQFMEGDTRADDSLDEISPAKLANHADAPILLIHGKDDSVVPFDQSLEMQAALKRAGKPVEMVVMPNEDHWLSRPETRLSMLTAAVAFVQRYDPAD